MTIIHTVNYHPDGSLDCTCGAVCPGKMGARRFLARHPRLCNERRAFAAQLAMGTRSVDADEPSSPSDEPDPAWVEEIVHRPCRSK